MPLISVRELIPFEQGNNDSDVIINNVHFNRTALDHHNYTLFSNGTLSNGTSCFLAFSVFQPHMLMNGTFINGTSCYSPIDNMGQHGQLGISFAVMFAISVMFSLVNLRKHGKRYLPAEKRWRAVGRRWKWYWMLFVAACGIISCLMSIDVDRDYLPGSPLVLQSFFYYLMTPTLMAAVWEAVRHWGSWQERQICDRDHFAFTEKNTRETQEFWMPLVFYLFAWLDFFLAIPRSWGPIQLQRSPEQQSIRAKPVATDARFKAASFIALMGMLVICYNLAHSIYRYRPRPTAGLRRRIFYLNEAPTEFLIAISLLGIKIGYTIASAFEWSISAFKYNANSGWIYGFGYAPALLVIVVFNIYGFYTPNEDHDLMAQRAEREHSLDADMGLGHKKPKWWRRMRPDYRPPALDENGQLKAFVMEIGGGKPTHHNLERYAETGSMPTRHGDENEDHIVPVKGVEVEASLANESNDFTESFTDESSQAGLNSQRRHSDHRNHSEARTTSSGDSTTLQGAPQRVRSMLDI